MRKDVLAQHGFTLTEIGALKRGEDVHREDGTVIPCSVATYRPYVPRSFAYCSDTAPFPELAQWVKGVDLLYHEATYLDALADQAIRDVCTPGNPREVTRDDIVSLYKQIL